MSLVEAIVLGIVQGLTEFLPISSSGHLRIVPALFGWDDPGAAFTAVTQLGTMLAVVIYFRQDLWRITSTWLRSLRDRSLRVEPRRPAGLVPDPGHHPDLGPRAGLQGPDRVRRPGPPPHRHHPDRPGHRPLRRRAGRPPGPRHRDVDTPSALAVGLAQALALIPGVSRSGATISAGLFLGFDRESAARFSFLLSIPAVVLSGLVTMPGRRPRATAPGLAATAVATVLAFVVGYAAIAWFLRYLASHSVTIFVIYRIALGVLVLGLVATGAVDAR